VPAAEHDQGFAVQSVYLLWQNVTGYFRPPPSGNSQRGSMAGVFQVFLNLPVTGPMTTDGYTSTMGATI
jgi:hypothetical protein